MPRPQPEAHRVAEIQLDDGTLPGRQVHELQAARHEGELRRPAHAAHHQAARRAPGAQAGRHHHAAERDQEVVTKVRHDGAPLLGVLDRPERRQQPRVIQARGAHPRAAQHVGQRQRNHRRPARRSTHHPPR